MRIKNRVKGKTTILLSKETPTALDYAIKHLNYEGVKGENFIFSSLGFKDEDNYHIYKVQSIKTKELSKMS